MCECSRSLGTWNLLFCNLSKNIFRKFESHTSALNPARIVDFAVFYWRRGEDGSIAEIPRGLRLDIYSFMTSRYYDFQYLVPSKLQIIIPGVVGAPHKKWKRMENFRTLTHQCWQLQKDEDENDDGLQFEIARHDDSAIRVSAIIVSSFFLWQPTICIRGRSR